MLLVLALWTGLALAGEALDAAHTARIHADETGALADYRAAAALYVEALAEGGEPHEIRWFLADTLRRAGDPEAAAAVYEDLLRTEAEHPYGDGAAWQLYLARRTYLVARQADLGVAPAGAAVERTTRGAEPVEVYALSDAHRHFVDAADLLLARTLAPSDEGLFVAANRAAILYEPAQLLHAHRRFAEARPRLERILAEHPRSPEASFAASLLVEGYVAEGDLAKATDLARALAADPPGPTGAPPPDPSALGFRACTAELEAARYAEAGACFLALVEQQPASELRAVALYNAAHSYERSGEAARATALYERYLGEYPDDDRARALYFRVASAHEARFELARAVALYELLARRFPDHVDAPAAAFNAAWLREGLDDPLGAARGYEAYARDFPTQPDGARVDFLAGPLYERADPKAARAFYARWLATWGPSDPDRAVTAKARLAVLHLGAGDTRRHDRLRDEILADWQASGGRLGPEARAEAARSALRPLLVEHEAILREAATVRAAASLRPLVDRFAAFETRTRELGAFTDLEVSATAAWLDGSAELALAEAADRAGAAEAEPLRAEAVARLGRFVRQSRQGAWTPWADLAAARLHEVDPAAWTPVRDELRAPPDVPDLPVYRPIRMPAG